MPQLTQNDPHAVAYARSLLELADAQGLAEQVGAELADIRQVLLENRPFQLYLRDPAVSTDARGAAIKRIFAGRVHPLVLNTMGVMNAKGRLGILDAVCTAYDDLLDQKLGKVEVDVTVARRLAADELEQVRQRIGQALGREAVVHQYVDESIIGGMVLRVQDRVIDGSIKAQLEALRRKMLAAKK
jgi:F-type H+-transporting ATPase subunit delta